MRRAGSTGSTPSTGTAATAGPSASARTTATVSRLAWTAPTASASLVVPPAETPRTRVAAPDAPRSDHDTAPPAAAASSTALDARTPAARVAWTARTSGSRGPVGVAVVEDVAGGDGDGAATASVEALPAVGAGPLGGAVHAAAAPTAPSVRPPRIARRETERPATGPSINRG